MNPLLSIIFLTFGILLAENSCLPYGNLYSDYTNRDDYYEDYYLRKIPKLKTSPKKVRFFLNHLSWFPMDNLQKDQLVKHHRERSYFVDLHFEPLTESTNSSCKTNTSNSFGEKLTEKFSEKLTKMKNFTGHKSWKKIKDKSMKKIQNLVNKDRMKAVIKNVVHPLRYRGPCKYITNRSKFVLTSCRRPLHPKSSPMQISETSTSTIYCSDYYTHFSSPRKVKVVVDLKGRGTAVSKRGRNVDAKELASVKEENEKRKEDKENSTNVLGTAGEMASDLAGRVTSLWHCVLGSHRNPETKDVKFYLYTRRNRIKPELLNVNYDLIRNQVKSSPHVSDIECTDLEPEKIKRFVRVSDENRQIIRSNYLNIEAPTKILIHGYTGSYRDSRMAKIKDAYLTSGRYNVIQVDWEMLAAPPCYIRVTQHSRYVGETIAKFLDGLYLVGLNMSLVHIVGFSLGAQVAGFAGNSTKVVPVCRITGLDPALPLFLHTEPSGHLDRLDAKFVDVIHTCGGILAMLDPLGHVDFYPNGGTRQPGCEFSNLKCSHSRAPQYFAESVISQKKFTGHLCVNWEEYLAGKCNNNTHTSFMGEPCSRKSVYGKYYLLTKSKEPFVL